MSGFKNSVVRGRGVKKSCVEGRMVIEKSCGNDEECIEIVLLKGGSLEIEWLRGGILAIVWLGGGGLEIVW